MTIWFYGDPHFGDENILLYDQRPFDNIKQMDRELIDLYNDCVMPEDVVYFTGDFGAEGHEEEILKQLNGHKRLIKGNHDVKSNDYYRAAGFEEVYDHPIVLEQFWIVSHEPLYVSKMAPYANIFAHVHTNPMYKTVSCRSYCTCVDRHNWRPVSFDEAKREVRKAA